METLKSGRNPKVEAILKKYENEFKPFLDEQAAVYAYNKKWLESHNE